MKLKKRPDIETNQQTDNSESKDDFELPDRILHPEEYEGETSMKSAGMDSTKNSQNFSNSNHAWVHSTHVHGKEEEKKKYYAIIVTLIL